LTEDAMPDAATIAAGLRALIGERHDPDAVDTRGFDAWSARASTRALAEALDLACERHRIGHAP